MESASQDGAPKPGKAQNQHDTAKSRLQMVALMAIFPAMSRN